MTQNFSHLSLPLSDAQKMAIHQQARRAQAEAFVAAGAAIITWVRGLFTRKPNHAIGSGFARGAR